MPDALGKFQTMLVKVLDIVRKVPYCAEKVSDGISCLSLVGGHRQLSLNLVI